MGTPVVVVTSGGLPVTEAANGFGMPIEVAANGFGTPITYVSKFGLPVVTGGGAPTPAYLALPSGASAIYSMWQVPGYSGPCLQVVPVNGTGTPTDIGFKADGSFDTDAMDALTGVLRLSALYDINGTGNHIVWGTNAARPILAKGGRIRGKQSIAMVSGVNYLPLPASVVVDRQNCSIISIDAAMAIQNLSGTVSLGTTGNNRLQISHASDPASTTVSSDTTNSPAGGRPLNYRTQPTFVASVHGPSNVIQYTDDKTITKTPALAVGSTAGGYIGKSDFQATAALFGNVFAVAIYGSKQVSPTEVAAAYASAKPIFDILPGLKQMVCGIDSLSAGIGTYDPVANPSDPDHLFYNLYRQMETLLSERIEVVNLGVSGQTVATAYANRAFYVNRYQAGYTKNLAHLWGGTNDIAAAVSGSIVGAGTTAWGTGTSGLLGMIRGVKTPGFTPIVGTTIPRNWLGSAQDMTDREGERLALNTLIRNNAAAEGYTVADYASIAALGSSGSVPSTYYVSDGIHLKPAGYLLAAQLLAPLVQGLL